jgi:HAD superfamily hydrolase (TIGR01509 family)
MLTILWDNDGVLVDTEGFYFQACRSILAGIDIDLTKAQFKEISLRQGESVFTLAADQSLSAEKNARLRAERDCIYANFLRTEPCVVDGAEEVLRSLHGKFRMGVVTSTLREHFEIVHAKSGLMPYLDFVIANGDYQRSKPCPDPYLTALERNGLHPANCIVVEDSERGLAAATAAGLECLVVRSEWTKDGNFGTARKVLESIREVTEEVLQWAAGVASQACASD